MTNKELKIQKALGVEPDKLTFTYKGLPCVLLKHPSMRHWCGYVGVPKDHPLYDKDNDDELVMSLDAHGGITWTGLGKKLSSLCKPKYWYIGFDCAHAGDYVPGVYERDGIKSGEKNIYRDILYVKNECIKLAKQLKENKL